MSSSEQLPQEQAAAAVDSTNTNTNNFDETLQEAESLMRTLGGRGSSSAGFCIDSDDDDDDLVELMKNPADNDDDNLLHPLHDDFLSNSGGNAPTATMTATNGGGGNAKVGGLAAAAVATTPMGGGCGGINPPPMMSSMMMMQPSQQQAQSQQSPAGFSFPHVSGGTAAAKEQIKASTSRFATNLANMAQKAANQVSTAVGTTTTTPGVGSVGSGTMMQSPLHQQPHPSHTPPPPSSQQQQQRMLYMQQQQQQQASPELDNEQKKILLQTYVGDLIPGERVIMFLSNILHVSDASGFQYNVQQQQQPWCCAVTYYRILLFATVSNIDQNNSQTSSDASSPHHTWNKNCWNTYHPHLLQMPLACIDNIEKTVFTATQSNTASGGLGSLFQGSGVSGNNINNSNSNSNPNLLNAAGGNIGGNNPNPNSNNTLSSTLLGLILTDKLQNRLKFTTNNYNDTNRLHESLRNYAFPGRRNLGYLFAFESKREQVMESVQTDVNSGQKIVTLEPTRKRYDAEMEFPRQFQNAQHDTSVVVPWSINKISNGNYQLCSNYPNILVVPSTLDESVYPDAARIVRQCASFRSEQRLPCLTWCGTGGASIWRCSQPKVGLQGNRSSADELFLKHISERAGAANSRTTVPPIVLPRSVLVTLTGSPDLSNWLPDTITTLKILDLRPRSSAMANRTGGYGYENTSNYIGCSLQFCNIANIHAVRDAMARISNVCQNSNSSDLQFTSAVEDSKWLTHIRLIWAASWETAYWTHVHRLPVLLHCSHGWDRTSQVAVLAQLLLDPYYRTLEGFSCLIEKDFMSFGHPFHTRCGHGEGKVVAEASPTTDEGQISPIFLQFLDCAFQVVNQYPECFEFNTRYLLLLSEHIYSCRFGNFLCDTERERELVASIRQRTHSVWEFLEAQDDVRNPGFQPDQQGGVLLMPLPTLLRNITVWKDRHCRSNCAKPTIRSLPATAEPLTSKFPTEQDVQFRILGTLSTKNTTPKSETPAAASTPATAAPPDTTEGTSPTAAETTTATTE